MDGKDCATISDEKELLRQRTSSEHGKKRPCMRLKAKTEAASTRAVSA
jgi:hypothetical protein